MRRTGASAGPILDDAEAPSPVTTRILSRIG